MTANKEGRKEFQRDRNRWTRKEGIKPVHDSSHQGVPVSAAVNQSNQQRLEQDGQLHKQQKGGRADA